MIAITAAAAALALGASAVNAISISSQCTSALTSLALGSGGDCINIAGLVPLATLSSTESVIPSVDSWLTGLCSSVSTTTCTNSTLEALGTNITTACGSNLESAGLSSSIVQQIPQLLQDYYGLGSEALCTRDTSNGGKHCVTSELTILQTSTGGNLTTSNIVTSVVNVLSNSTLEKELACTTCVQGIYSIVKPALGTSISGSVDDELNGLCGSGFVTTTEPSGIIIATGTLATQTASSTSTSNAASSNTLISFSGMSSLAVLVSLGACLMGASGVFAAI